jgi:hypothetical protein
MTSSNLHKRHKTGLVESFKATITSFEDNLKSISDGSTIIAGTDDKPIVSGSTLIPIRHFFMDGVYVREMTMYKDTVVVGAIHKHLHMCFLLTGKITVVNEKETVDHVAPCFIVSTPGIKRVLYAHEDSIWYNIHKNPKSTEDTKELETNIIALSYEEYEEYIKNK